MVFLTFFCKIKSFFYNNYNVDPPIDSVVIEIPSNLTKEDDTEMDNGIAPEIKNLFT